MEHVDGGSLDGWVWMITVILAGLCVIMWATVRHGAGIRSEAQAIVREAVEEASVEYDAEAVTAQWWAEARAAVARRRAAAEGVGR